MGPKLHEFSVTLQRDSPLTPWGFRLIGGCDLDTPLIVTKVGVTAYFCMKIDILEFRKWSASVFTLANLISYFGSSGRMNVLWLGLIEYLNNCVICLCMSQLRCVVLEMSENNVLAYGVNLRRYKSHLICIEIMNERSHLWGNFQLRSHRTVCGLYIFV